MPSTISARDATPLRAHQLRCDPESLVENELFGHARGAYTDARESRQGVIAQAEGGTLFLDEAEAMGPRGQVALLRFLEDRQYRPVGGTPCGANVRVVASSNADLAALAADGRYRQDLLFRLNILVLELPRLRDRGDDVLLLAETFVHRFCRQYRKAPMTMHPDSARHLETREWPGNVRELENLIHRAVVMTDGAVLRVGPAADPRADGRPAALTVRGFREAKARAIAAFEKAYLAELLARTRGNLSLAARLAGKAQPPRQAREEARARARDVQPRGRVRLRRRRPARAKSPHPRRPAHPRRRRSSPGD